jgi:hypothetical protein
MTAIIFDAQVERFDPLLVEGRLYYVQMMVIEPTMSNHYYKLGSSLMCYFTSKTTIREITTVNNKFMPSFPPFTPLDRVF